MIFRGLFTLDGLSVGKVSDEEVTLNTALALIYKEYEFEMDKPAGPARASTIRYGARDRIRPTPDSVSGVIKA